jgi:ribosomal protein S18 acetylase RimI-like enzyme
VNYLIKKHIIFLRKFSFREYYTENPLSPIDLFTPMKVTIRKSTSSDLVFLEELEKTCFPKFKQSSRRAIRYSISSPFQKVITAEITEHKEIKPAGSATLFLYPKTLRLFSIAVKPEFQGKGVGKQLMEHIIQFARSGKFERISLEARKSDKRLIQYYELFGFKVTEELPEYYSKEEDGMRMIKILDENGISRPFQTLSSCGTPKTGTSKLKG